MKEAVWQLGGNPLFQSGRFRLLSFKNLEVAASSSSKIAFQKGGLQVREKDVPGL